MSEEKLAQSKGKLAQYLCKILDVYFSYHREAYNTTSVYLHDPTTLLAAVDPSLMTYTEGVVRVQTNGITRGLTLFYNTQKRFAEVTEWSNMHENLEAVWMMIQDSYSIDYLRWEGSDFYFIVKGLGIVIRHVVDDWYGSYY
ncbi:uridine nucleosidase [Ranunculus cassubicifolius]